MKTKDLLDAINTVMPGTNKKGLLDNTDMLIIMKGMIHSYNDKVSVTAYFSGIDIECAVQADKFRKIVKGIDDPEISLKMDGKTLRLVSENTEAEIRTTQDMGNVIGMVKDLGIDKLKWEDLPDDFNTGLSLLRFNVSDDYSDQNNLFCLNIENDMMYSADNFRISKYKLSSDCGCKFLIPKKNLDDLCTFQPNGFAKVAGWLHFINEEDNVFSCRSVTGTYPSIESMFDVEKEFEIIKFPNELENTLDSVLSLFEDTSDSHKAVNIELNDGYMYCEIQKEKFWVKKKLKMPNKKVPEVKFKLSSVFLGEILKYTKDVKLTKSKAVFETDVFKHLLILGVN